MTVNVNDTNVTLSCTTPVGVDIIDTSIWEIFLRNGTYWTVSASDQDIHRSRLGFYHSRLIELLN